MNTKSYVIVSLLQVHLCIFMQLAILDFMLVCIFRLHYEFERVFPSSFLWIFNQLWSFFDPHFLIFFRDLNRNFYFKQLIDFGAFSFLLSISFHIFLSSIFRFLFLHLFSSKSPLGHNISHLMIYLGSAILISFILHLELYLLFNLIKFINLLFLLYFMLILIMRGQYLSNSILDSILSILSSTCLSQNLFVFFVLMCSRIDHTSGLFCDPKLISHFNFFL